MKTYGIILFGLFWDWDFPLLALWILCLFFSVTKSSLEFAKFAVGQNYQNNRTNEDLLHILGKKGLDAVGLSFFVKKPLSLEGYRLMLLRALSFNGFPCFCSPSLFTFAYFQTPCPSTSVIFPQS